MSAPKHFDIVVAVFVTTLILSNILSSAKIIDLGIALGPIDLIFDAGTILFPISYIFGDILTEVYGYARSRRVIWIGFAMMALTGASIWLTGLLPAESTWSQSVGADAYQAVLGGVPGLLTASLAAYWIGEFANSYVLARMKLATGGRWVWSRTISSTLVGQMLDTTVFVGIATVLGVFPPEIALPLIATNYIFKVAIEVVFTPLTLRIIRALKHSEGVDHFDRGISFNPFHLRG